ncbi:PPOX class F420-dependent oxidoreductase [Winogradskya consettensis]|uniref:PPOX class F420-dependent oxidoreductase n=1 Tax=Winogradskya consettensis TaxID=113560 RepID=A0A919VLR6_9ACTN|nr:PPOX class F420-dependent oxidoreductase [Actinoplanes consettensis]GIM68034.1 PPOX class F420-dependent oxidoreductase [Actinoplanes consettensis]
MTDLDRLSGEKFVLLTTFRRDGRPVPTPVWVVPRPGGLAVWTAPGSGKVKRVRNNGHVTLAPCTARGTVTGPEVPAQARIAERAAVPGVLPGLRRKYGLLGRVLIRVSLLRHGIAGSAVILLTPTER